MESLVLCPEELCLGPARITTSSLVGLSPMASEFSIWTAGDLEKGTRFVPWKGTVRSDKLPVHDKLPDFDVSFERFYTNGLEYCNLLFTDQAQVWPLRRDL